MGSAKHAFSQVLFRDSEPVWTDQEMLSTEVLRLFS